jgi:pyruvate-ferredoxin/flavodoxin oxidoreductase
VGIEDDVTHLSLSYDHAFNLDEQHAFRGLFFGLGADGTVSANKNSIKIIGEKTDNHVQGYFVYDSKKSGSLTSSHLRFGRNPIRGSYLVASASFVACHHFNYLFKFDILKDAAPGGVFLLNAPYEKDEVWGRMPAKIQEEIKHKKLKFYAINAYTVAKQTGMATALTPFCKLAFLPFQISYLEKKP